MNGILMKPFLRKAVERDHKTQTRRLKEPKLKVGDHLFIRETVYVYGHWVRNGTTKTGKQKYQFVIEDNEVRYSDNAPKKLLGYREIGKLGWVKRSPLHCRAQDARTFIEVTGLRKERLQDITEEDAIEEGIEKAADFGTTGYKLYTEPDAAYTDIDAKWSFQSLWESINGEESWVSNPMVYVIDFKRIESKAIKSK